MILETSINITFGIWVLLLFSLLILLSGIALFIWAYFSGQFDDINKGAQLPFDEEEPPGKPTDQIFKKDESNNEA